MRISTSSLSFLKVDPSANNDIFRYLVTITFNSIYKIDKVELFEVVFFVKLNIILCFCVNINL